MYWCIGLFSHVMDLDGGMPVPDPQDQYSPSMLALVDFTAFAVIILISRTISRSSLVMDYSLALTVGLCFNLWPWACDNADESTIKFGGYGTMSEVISDSFIVDVI